MLLFESHELIAVTAGFDSYLRTAPYLRKLEVGPQQGFICFADRIRGWGNGYVLVGKEHPLYGKSYEQLSSVDVHGGVTFADRHIYLNEGVLQEFNIKDTWWAIGFDTNHGFSDNMSEDDVEKETYSLLQQIHDVLHFKALHPLLDISVEMSLPFITHQLQKRIDVAKTILESL